MSLARYIDIQYRITQSTYLGDRYTGVIQSMINSKDSGGSIGNNKASTILSSIGEFLERERLIKDKVDKEHRTNLIQGYSLLNKRITKVSIDNIIGDGSNFIDTCGMASHTNSLKCLFNGIGEFIERQSYIFNYLSKGNARLINLDNNEKFKPVLNSMNYLKFYEISLIDDYYVVLGKGIHNGKFYVGLGSSNCIEEAISKSIGEIMQLEMVYQSKGSENKIGINNKRNSYVDVFLKLPTEGLINAYKYLDNKCDIYDYNDFTFTEFSIENIFQKLNRQYSMEPLIFFIKPIRDIESLKIIKVLDLNWFPNMFPKTYDKAVYDYVENATNVKLDRECSFIPFP